MKNGLLSVSFRKLTVEEIIEQVKKAGLDGIEWGGDVHVPAGDVEKAKYVAKLMEEAGLETLSYGSYFNVGDMPVEEFRGVIDCAMALNTRIVRVWAGSKSPNLLDVSQEYYNKIIADSQAICDMAKPYGLTICYEYHGWTLTENVELALKAVQAVDRENMCLYWQPNFCFAPRANLAVLKQVLPYVRNMHVFKWTEDYARYPLEDGREEWESYIALAETTGKVTAAMLEFIKDDSLEQFQADAKVLKELTK